MALPWTVRLGIRAHHPTFDLRLLKHGTNRSIHILLTKYLILLLSYLSSKKKKTPSLLICQSVDQLFVAHRQTQGSEQLDLAGNGGMEQCREPVGIPEVSGWPATQQLSNSFLEIHWLSQPQNCSNHGVLAKLGSRVGSTRQQQFPNTSHSTEKFAARTKTTSQGVSIQFVFMVSF